MKLHVLTPFPWREFVFAVQTKLEWSFGSLENIGDLEPITLVRWGDWKTGGSFTPTHFFLFLTQCGRDEILNDFFFELLGFFGCVPR